jgi:hypothetical protein
VASSLEYVSNIPPVRLQDANIIQQRIFCAVQTKFDDFSKLFAASQKMQLVKKGMSTSRDKAVEDKSKRVLTANRCKDIIESFHNVLFMLGLPLGNLG